MREVWIFNGKAWRRIVGALSVLFVLTGTNVAGAAAPSALFSVATDRPSKIPRGATFTVPKAWSGQNGPSMAVPSYTNPELGHISVRHYGKETAFDFGLWKSRMASRKNDHGTVSFVTVEPTIASTDGFPFATATRAGKRVLILRDGQHECVYKEAA